MHATYQANLTPICSRTTASSYPYRHKMEAVPERTVPHPIPLYALPERDHEAAFAQLAAQLSAAPDM
jgi:hypothetical protein